LSIEFPTQTPNICTYTYKLMAKIEFKDLL